MYAVKQGNESIVRLLLERGADVHAEILDEEALKQRACYEEVQLVTERIVRGLRELQTANGEMKTNPFFGDGADADAETIGDVIADAETNLLDWSNCIYM